MKNPHLSPDELDIRVVSETLQKLPMREIKPSDRFKLSDMIWIV